MNDLASTVGLMRREFRDVHSVVSRLDHQLRQLTGGRGSANPGQQIVTLAAARLARMLGNERAADQLETKAATAPAMTGTATWAAELITAGLPAFILSLERRSALAVILAKSPQISLLRVGAHSVPVAGPRNCRTPQTSRR